MGSCHFLYKEPNFVELNAFTYSGGQITRLKVYESQDGSSYSKGIAINDVGDVVGECANGSGAFLASNGHNMIVLGTLGGTHSWARDINNAGTVVGGSYVVDDTQATGQNTHAFSYSNGQMTDLGTPAGMWSRAYAINNAGTAVGSAILKTINAITARAVVFSNGQVADLGVYGSALDINDAGYIVGHRDEYYNTYAFLYRDGQVVDLDTLVSIDGTWLVSAVAINNRGQIVARGYNNHSYLLTPNVIPGDCNGDGVTNAADLTQINVALYAGSTDLKYDLNGDSVVDYADVEYLLHTILNSTIGDADLNGVVDIDDYYLFIDGWYGL